MPSIPTEWFYSGANPGIAAAVLTIPASPGITHILTHLTAQELSVNGAGQRIPSVQVIDAATSTILYDWQMVNNAGQNGATGSDACIIDTDLFLISTVGSGLIIAFNAAVTANQGQRIMVRGYSV